MAQVVSSTLSGVIGYDLRTVDRENKLRAIEENLELLRLLLEEADRADYIGEQISQLQHGLQCGKFATDSGAEEEVILASLFHDIGHFCTPGKLLMGNVGVAEHEKVGAEFLLALGFSPRIARLVEGHVQAKRYLTWKNESYLAKLSPASKLTLAYQGGPMTEEEARQFEKNPDFHDILKMRTWDEKAKIPNWVVPGLNQYLQVARRHLICRV